MERPFVIIYPITRVIVIEKYFFSGSYSVIKKSKNGTTEKYQYFLCGLDPKKKIVVRKQTYSVDGSTGKKVGSDFIINFKFF